MGESSLLGCGNHLSDLYIRFDFDRYSLRLLLHCLRCLEKVTFHEIHVSTSRLPRGRTLIRKLIPTLDEAIHHRVPNEQSNWVGWWHCGLHGSTSVLLWGGEEASKFHQNGVRAHWARRSCLERAHLPKTIAGQVLVIRVVYIHFVHHCDNQLYSSTRSDVDGLVGWRRLALGTEGSPRSSTVRGIVLQHKLHHLDSKCKYVGARANIGDPCHKWSALRLLTQMVHRRRPQSMPHTIHPVLYAYRAPVICRIYCIRKTRHGHRLHIQSVLDKKEEHARLLERV